MITLLFSLALSLQDADRLPVVTGAEPQPLRLHVGRLKEALEYLGQPPAAETAAKLEAALKETDPDKAVRAIQEALDPLCLLGVHINPESRVKVEAGPAPKRLVQHGWRTFLLKVQNEAGITAPLRAHSESAALPFEPASGSPAPAPGLTAPGLVQLSRQHRLRRKGASGRQRPGARLRSA